MPSTEFLLYLVIVIFVVFIIMNYYKTNVSEKEPEIKYIPVYQNEKTNVSNNVSNNIKTNKNLDDDQTINIDINNKHSHIPISVDPLRKFDYDALDDDFTPPFRRSYYDDDFNYRYEHHGHHGHNGHNGHNINPLYPTYTRGPPGRFRKIGTLIAQGVSATDNFKFLIMMGRQKYNCRDFEYYALSPNADQRLKFYIETKGKEINNDDVVNVNELDGYTFKFKEDIDLSPRYDPYIV